MKIIKSLVQPFTFKSDGSTEVLIDSNGARVSDEVAKTIKVRFGSIVSIEEATLDEIIEEVKADESKTTEEEKPLEKMSAKELQAKASSLGIALTGEETKKEIISVIQSVVSPAKVEETTASEAVDVA